MYLPMVYYTDTYATIISWLQTHSARLSCPDVMYLDPAVTRQRDAGSAATKYGAWLAGDPVHVRAAAQPR